MNMGITHFTSQSVAAAIFDGWLRDIRSNEHQTEPIEINLRLYSRSGMNDPMEQKISEYGSDVTVSKRSTDSDTKQRNTVPDDAFLMCGTAPQTGKKGEALNRLDMWRVYGDNGKGVAITTWWDSERIKEIEGLEIIEVDYDSNLDHIKCCVNKLLKDQTESSKSQSERDSIRKQRLRLEIGHKHKDYKSENEVRLACFLGDESGAVLGSMGKEIHLDATSGRLRTFIERPVQVGTSLSLYKVDITLGPRQTGNEVRHWQRVAQWVLARMRLSGGTVRRSELQYIG